MFALDGFLQAPKVQASIEETARTGAIGGKDTRSDRECQDRVPLTGTLVHLSIYIVALLSHIVLVLVFNPLNLLLLHCQVAGKELPLHYCACEIHMQDLVYLCTHLNWAWHNEMAMVSIVHVRQYRIMSHAVLPVNDRDWLRNQWYACMVVLSEASGIQRMQYG